jgi:hypothetical protein
MEIKIDDSKTACRVFPALSGDILLKKESRSLDCLFVGRVEEFVNCFTASMIQ